MTVPSSRPRVAAKPLLVVASASNPSDASSRADDYHLRLGALYEYSPVDIQVAQAEENFRAAARLNPYDPQTWLDLAGSLELQGRMEDASGCLRKVHMLAPNIPAYQWPIANFYLLQGNVDEAFRHFKVVLAGTAQYNTNVFSAAWKTTDDPNKILQDLIPERVDTELSYLNFLIAQHHLDEAQGVWKRIMTGHQEFSPNAAGGYIDSLINARRGAEAFEVWTDLQKAGIVPYSSTTSEKNLIYNGDFEDKSLNFGFAWRIVPVEGAYAGLDTSTFHSPSHALLIQFSGSHNLLYEHVFQYVKVTPGQSYRLRVFAKAEGITTDTGPHVQVFDAYNPALLNKSSEDLTGTTDGWIPLIMDFAAGPKTDLIVIRLTRIPSRKFDNLIAGKLWLDDVQLVAVQNVQK